MENIKTLIILAAIVVISFDAVSSEVVYEATFWLFYFLIGHLSCGHKTLTEGIVFQTLKENEKVSRVVRKRDFSSEDLKRLVIELRVRRNCWDVYGAYIFTTAFWPIVCVITKLKKKHSEKILFEEAFKVDDEIGN